MTRPKRWTRRKLIVDRTFQLQLMLRTAVASLCLLTVLTAGLVVPLIMDMHAEQADEASFMQAADTLLYMHSHFWPIAFICVLLAIASSVRLSHRIAGPMVQIKRHIDAVAAGALPRTLSTRKRDYMKNEAERLCRMTQSVAERIDSIKTAERQLAQALDECDRELRAARQDAACEAMTRARESAAALRERLAYFRRIDHASAPATPQSAVASDADAPVEPLVESN